MFDKMIAGMLKDKMPGILEEVKKNLHSELDKIDVNGDGVKDIDELKTYISDLIHHLGEMVKIGTEAFILIKLLVEKFKK